MGGREGREWGGGGERIPKLDIGAVMGGKRGNKKGKREGLKELSRRGGKKAGSGM